jgi:uncharacterized RDD family membrane protein YckC
MQKIEMRTTQSVLIDYEVASLGDRIGAFLLDALLIGAYYALIGLLNYQTEGLPYWLSLILIPPAFFYHLICEIFLNGQSLGKRLLHLKVVRLDGTQPGTGSYLLRFLLRPLDIWLYGSVAVITILINGKGQRLGDLAAGTTVVKYTDQQAALEQQFYSQQAEGAYELQFPEASRLTEQEIAQIQETLRTYRLTANTQAVQQMAEQVQAHLGLRSDMPPVALLNTLVKDYKYLSTHA